MSKELLKWNQISKILSGSDNSVRANKIPNKYKKDVALLLVLVDSWKKWIEEN